MTDRAILFDLDNTLYSERRFILSGFSAVARAVRDREGVPACEVYRVLVRALRAGRRGTAFQELCTTFGFDRAQITGWVEIVRTHAPRLRARRHTRALLADLRDRWRLGLVTNGLPEVQRRKIDSLRLRPFFDHIGLAGMPGQGGKPSPTPFMDACRVLGVSPDRAVHVGDDVETDVRGAKGAGIKTIWLANGERSTIEPAADCVVASLADVAAAAEGLVRHA